MTQKQAYISAYFFLESYWAETKSEDLVHLLSSMNPFLWADGGSADPAIYEEWLKCSKKIAVDEPLNAEQTFNVILEFLKYYHDEFEFAPMWLIDDLIAKTCNTPKWLECVSNAMQYE